MARGGIGGSGGGGGSSTPEAATLVVSPTPGVGDYATIQDAIDNLPVEGGYILVREGTYNENLTVESDVILKGCGRGNTVLNIGSVDNTSAIANASTSAFIVVRDMSIVGDSTKIQSLLDIQVSSSVLFENVEVTDILQAVLSQSDPEVTFNHCTLNMPNVADWSAWNGLAGGGDLYWTDVELNVAHESANAIVGQPNWTVTASSGGGGPTFSSYDIARLVVQGFTIDRAIFTLNDDNSRIVNLDGAEVKFVWLGSGHTMTGSRWTTSDGNPGLDMQASNCLIAGCLFQGSGGSIAVAESGGADGNKYGPNLGFGGSTITGTSSSIVGPKYTFTVPGAVTADAATNDDILVLCGTGDVIDTLQAFARVAPTGDDLIAEFFLVDLTTGAIGASIGTATIADGDSWSGRVAITPVAIPTDQGLLMQVTQVGSGVAGSNLTGTAS